MNPLKPVRFYGSDLPRPRYLDDTTHERVDPPLPVNDSLLRWAKEANWSMGGLSFKRQRMQGKIEGRLSKLRNFEEDDDEIPRKVARKALLKTSPGMSPPLKKLSSKATRPKQSSGVVQGRYGKGSTESPVVVMKSPAAVHPLGEWGEEDGPTPRRVSPRAHVSTMTCSPLKPVSLSSPMATYPSPVSASIEFPVRRRQMERSLPDVEDSDGDVNWEEFSRIRDRPSRRSSRVTSLRRSFKEFAFSSDSELDSPT